MFAREAAVYLANYSECMSGNGESKHTISSSSLAPFLNPRASCHNVEAHKVQGCCPFSSFTLAPALSSSVRIWMVSL